MTTPTPVSTDADTSESPSASGSGPRLAKLRFSSLSARLAMLLGVLLASSAIATAIFSAVSVGQNETANSRQTTANAHESTRLLIDQASADVERYRVEALASRKVELKNLTMALVGGLDRLRLSVDHGEISDAAAHAAGEKLLYDYRYGLGNGNYFFAFTPTMDSIVEPNPTFRGNMWNFQDKNGKFFFHDFAQVALGPGEGYVDYVGTRPGASVPADKISYIRYFKPWKWVIGTGVYLDDIAAEATARLEADKKSLSATLAKIVFSDTGFFFVLDRSGKVLVAPENRALSPLVDTTWGKALISAAVLAVPESQGPIAHLQSDAALRDGQLEPWAVDVSKVTSTDWILVSVVPAAELTQAGTSLATRQIILELLVLLLGLGIGLLASRRIVRPVQDLTHAATALSENRFEPTSLDHAAARSDEVGTLARAFQRMGAEVVARERKLREQLTKLSVVIDHKKVERDLGEIVESDFFHDLELRAAALRERGPSDTVAGPPA